MITLLYAKSLYNCGQYVACFELLQSEFGRYPSYSIFLLEYAKSVIKSKSKNYYGSAIGALEECTRVCTQSR
jgi:hypothetical protein